MFRQLGLLPGMSGAQLLLFVEAAFFLALARFAILVVPFRRIVAWLERSPDSPQHDVVTIGTVRQAVEIAARNVPWNAGCLPQAMACKAKQRDDAARPVRLMDSGKSKQHHDECGAVGREELGA